MTGSWKRLARSLALLAACVALSAPALAETIELKVSHYLPPSQTINTELTRWAADLEQKSGGRLKLTIFPSGQMGPMARQYDLARTGVADMAFFMHGALPGRFPLTEVAQLPYAFSRPVNGQPDALSVSKASAVLTGLSDRLAAEHAGTHILYMIASPTIGLYFRKETVPDPARLKGLRVRHNGPITAAMISAWGASPVAMPPSELADALDKGTVDGMMFNFEAAEAFQLADSLKTVTPLNSSAATFALVINQRRYDSLPADLRQLIDDTTGVSAAARIGKAYDTAEASGRAYLAGHGVTILTSDQMDAAAFARLAGPIAEAQIEKGGAKAAAMQSFWQALRADVTEARP